MQISVVVIDSRSHRHPDWVQMCLESIQKQTRPVDELIVVDNKKRDKTIGECWNNAVKEADGEWVFFVGDDCFIARDCVQVMLNHSDTTLNCVTTYMTMFDEKEYKAVQRPCTGMWRRSYLLEHPFNETLDKGIDREYFQEAEKRGDFYHLIPYYFGHYDRRHDDHRSSKVIMSAPEKTDIYVTSSGGVNFIAPLVNEWKKTKQVFIAAQPFDPLIKTDLIWCEWANANAVTVAKFKTEAKKILRLHSYEAYTPFIYYIDFKAFDKVIFIAEHIKEYVESKIGKLDNAVVIPVGIDVDKFKFVEKEKNNKICYAGEISRKKGIGELFLIAKEFPEMEFHIAGKFREDDVAWWFFEKKPNNVFLYPYSYNLQEFFKDKTYFISTSLREGNPITVLEAMACGLKPLVNDWVGSEIYEGYTFKNINDLESLLETYNPKEYREFAEQYDIKNTIREINGYL